MFHPELEVSELCNDRVDLHGNRLTCWDVLDRREIDLEKADFQQFAFGVGDDLTGASPLLTSDEKNLNSAG